MRVIRTITDLDEKEALESSHLAKKHSISNLRQEEWGLR
ncbi:MAG: hypothetical protein ABI045_03720 [Flavobacteriales bacterium]